ncbi:hypothetical protein [Dactylosporangium sp. CA-233914]|uniref:hypothetical protein n=1 Tax=Dactylosporangium sp. CA-233914 TaxID=3239934 RepID=UPI003D8B1865
MDDLAPQQLGGSDHAPTRRGLLRAAWGYTVDLLAQCGRTAFAMYVPYVCLPDEFWLYTIERWDWNTPHQWYDERR